MLRRACARREADPHRARHHPYPHATCFKIQDQELHSPLKISGIISSIFFGPESHPHTSTTSPLDREYLPHSILRRVRASTEADPRARAPPPPLPTRDFLQNLRSSTAQSFKISNQTFCTPKKKEESHILSTTGPFDREYLHHSVLRRVRAPRKDAAPPPPTPPQPL